MCSVSKLTGAAVVLVLLGGGLSFCARSSACSYAVREAGFFQSRGTTHQPVPCRVTYICEKGLCKGREYMKRIRIFCTTELPGVNLVCAMIAVDRLKPGKIDELMKKYGTSRENLPVTVIDRVSEGEQQILLVMPGKITEEMIRSLVFSPTRLKLKQLLIDTTNYCVVVFIPSVDRKASTRVRNAVQEAVLGHMEKESRQRIPVLDVDWNAAPDPFFLTELGGNSLVTVAVATVIFGKGCQLLPVLKGEKITRQAVMDQFTFLDKNASDCTPDAVFFRDKVTKDLLMQWTPQNDETIIREVKLPDDPKGSDQPKKRGSTQRRGG